MGALGGCPFDGELENGLKLGHLLEDDEEEEELELGSGSGSESTAAIEDAVRVLLQELGEDPDREGLRKTPLRVAKALRAGTRGYSQEVNDIVQGALFPVASSDSGKGHAEATGIVVVRDIDVFSFCESCLLPLRTQCHVGYVPSRKRVVGLSKLARVADVFAKRLQHPQRLADEVCSALHNSIRPEGVAVALQCWHIQFPEAGVRSCHNSKQPSKLDMPGWVHVSVNSRTGIFGDDGSSFWVDFLGLLKLRGVNVENNCKVRPLVQNWCPLRSMELTPCNKHSTRNATNRRMCTKAECNQAAMVAAATSILYALGDNPLRKELALTPYCFVRWLMKFKRSSMGMKLNGFDHGWKDMPKEAHEDVGQDQNIVHSELNLPFYSQCEHHLLPFHGVVHIGYFDAEDAKSIERSVLQAIVQFHGYQLQMQERLTRQIAATIYSMFGRGVMVVVEANHICMMSRGIEKVGSSTATISVMGGFSTNPGARASFLQTILNSTASRG